MLWNQRYATVYLHVQSMADGHRGRTGQLVRQLVLVVVDIDIETVRTLRRLIMVYHVLVHQLKSILHVAMLLVVC